MGEKIEIDREELFVLLGEFYDKLSSDHLEFINKRMPVAILSKNFQALVDKLNHNILEKSERKEKPKDKPKKGRTELDWS